MELLCHYTPNIKKIIKQADDGYIFLRANCSTSLEDICEYRGFIKELKSKVKRYAYNNTPFNEQQNKDLNSLADLVPYTLSFTKLSDDSIMWNYFADKMKGVCIQFDFENLPDISDVDNISDKSYFYPHDLEPITYGRKVQDMEIPDDYIEDFYRAFMKGERIETLVNYKIADKRSPLDGKLEYRLKREVRVIRHPIEDIDDIREDCGNKYFDMRVPIECISKIVIGKNAASGTREAVKIFAKMHNIKREKKK